ncbi:E-selectin-like [Saccostrea cucullata]|uniref:E-selectin-like n=1 Tax=Saccostrea cuccullata TaxID=36930 RepID=UPI002ED428DC
MANTTLSCNSSGQWSPDTDRVCTEILCLSSIHHARLALNCSRKVAETCDFSCETNYDRVTPDYITCNSSGDWNKDTSNLCLPLTNVSTHIPDSEIGRFLYVYIGIGFGVLVALVVFIVACRIIHLRKKTKPTGLQYES